jgi:hypothetical protein
VASADDLLFGTAPRPVSCGRGVRLGAAASALPETEDDMIAAMRDAYPKERRLPKEYGL